MAMKIVIGKFGEDGEPIWFEVESDDCKKGREADSDKVKGGDNDVVEADGIVVTNPMKDVGTKTLPTKKVFGSSV